jgi:hypothetical protein
MSKIIDLVGQKFGKLTVIKQYKEYKGKDRHTYWVCKCSCGNEKDVIVSSDKLKNGNTKSCGCYIKESNKINGLLRKTVNTFDLSGEYGIGYTLGGKEYYFDLEDYDKIKDYCWYIKEGYVAYSDNENRTTLRMHVLLMGNPLEEVDHIDRHRNNNRKYNLRLATDAENARNQSLRKKNTTGFIGVSLLKDGKWKSRIRHNNKDKCLGTFVNKTDAIIARLQAELKYFGIEFAPQRHLFKEYNII